MHVLRFLSPRLSSFFASCYAAQRLLDASPSTLKVYRITLGFFDEFLGRPARLCDLNDETVGAFAQHRMTVVSRATTKRDLDCLFAIWRFAHASGKLRTGPTLKQLQVATPEPVALSREEIDAVWQSIQTEPSGVLVGCSPSYAVPAPIWWGAIFLVIWDTAERISAVMDLTEGDLDLQRGWVRFPADARKGKTADNLKSLHPDTCEAVAQLLEMYPLRRRDSKIFRWASNRGGVWTRLGKIMSRAGLPDSREFKFHAVRKSSVSHFAAAGGDPVAHAGHSSEVVTRRHYLDKRITGTDSAPAVLFRPGRI